MKKLAVILIVLLGAIYTYAQTDQPCSTCLPDGIFFSTQSQIDSFQINYPNCTEIAGNVTISDNWNGNITNLNGLNQITFIGGNMTICGNSGLASLNGLENLVTVGQSLFIGIISYGGNPLLSNLSGLNGLTSVGYDLWIIDNDNLSNLTGLNSLNTIQHDLNILYNDTLSNLSGLEGLTYIGGGVDIAMNNALISLNGLDNLTSVEMSLWIGDNYYGGNNSLIDITALSNLTYIGGSISIYNDNSLTSLSGLESLSEVIHIGLVQNSSLTDISALINLTSLIGELNIIANPSLLDLNGLQNLSTIGGELYISQNLHLLNLDGLSGLVSVGGDVYIGKSHFLTNLNGLSNLNTIGGKLTIEQLDFLTSLDGIDSIDSETINELVIRNNSLLSSCDVQSICDYLASPNGTIEIHDNATGCDSQQEVEDACFIGVEETTIVSNHLNIYPNPTSTQITIELTKTTTPPKNTTLTIYSVNGQQILSRQITEAQTLVDVSGLVSGIYFVRVISDNDVMVGKMVKE